MANEVFSSVTNAYAQAQGTATASSGIGTGWIIGIAVFIGIAIVSIIGAFIYYYFFSKKQWTITTRVHYENPQINGVSIGNGIPTKRIRFKDGRVVYMYKTPIQGYTISPELLTWTSPRVHDVIVTQDKKLFCLNGINSIDIQRKTLNVDISYPDIEMDRQDLQQHIDSKKFDDPNERFKIIAKMAMWIFVFIFLIVAIILGGKAYNDGKATDLARDQLGLQVAANNVQVTENLATFTVALERVMPDLMQIKGYQVLGNYSR